MTRLDLPHRPDDCVASKTGQWVHLGQSILSAQAIGQVARAIRNRLHSRSDAVILRRDLRVPHRAPAATIPIRVRPIAPPDHALILEGASATLSGEERWLRIARRRLLDAGFGRCFVAVTDDDVPCYMQFLFAAADNRRIRDYFSGAFPWLQPDEALLESAYTPAAFRGRKIMPAAMSRIAEHAGDHGARSVITLVGTDNVPSLRGCAGAGFEPCALLEQRWRFLRCRTDLRPLAGSLPRQPPPRTLDH